MQFKDLYPFLGEMRTRHALQHANGTYVCLNLCEQSRDALHDWVDEYKIPNPADPKQYHSTVIYSRKGVPSVAGYRFKLPVKGKIVRWDVFPNGDKKCLVAVVESPDMIKYHEAIRERYGATHDFEEYTPHVTVSYDYGNRAVPLAVPKFNLLYDSVKVEPLDKD